ncbi:MAG: hypothetical protein ACREQ9_13260, partial [Candidatus Binatia bacterium]
MTPDGIRQDFPGLEGIVHLNSASTGAPPRDALDAVRRQLRLLETGAAGRPWADFLQDLDEGVGR